MKKIKTSITVDPDVWEAFKKVASAHKRSSAAELEMIMEDAIAGYRRAGGSVVPTAPTFTRDTDLTSPSGRKRGR
jgi:hypothetical protein